jgi:hypothetical protein
MYFRVISNIAGEEQEGNGWHPKPGVKGVNPKDHRSVECYASREFCRFIKMT